MVKDEYPEASKTAADEMLPRWLGAMEGLVSNLSCLERLNQGAGNEWDWENLAVLNECWKVSSFDPQDPSSFRDRLTSSFFGLLSLDFRP